MWAFGFMLPTKILCFWAQICGQKNFICQESQSMASKTYALKLQAKTTINHAQHKFAVGILIQIFKKTK